MERRKLRRDCRISENVSALIVATIAAVVYWITADSGASFWDCPEYVVCASLLEIGHPPGNPVWMLFMRAATIPFPRAMHAVVINICSGIFMALAVYFLFRIILILSYQLLLPRKREASLRGERWARRVSMICSASGALTFAFCDSVWYSAVEAEVYAMSTFLSALSIWLMLRWAATSDRGKQSRLLILIAYVMGLSLGVHQLNLLCIPVLAMIFVYRRNSRNDCGGKVWLAIFVSFVIVAALLIGMLDFSVRLAGACELLCVNGFGWPMFSGVIIFAALAVIIPLVVIRVAYRFNWNHWISDSVWMLMFVFIGFSSFAVILIRGYAAPPMNEAAPTDIFALHRYVSRDQYGSKPLFYGATPYSQPILREDWKAGEKTPSYTRYLLEKKDAEYVPFLPGARFHQRAGFMTGADSTANDMVMTGRHGYLISDHSFKRVTTPELDMWFPRITGGNPSLLESYESWAGMDRTTMDRVEVSEAIDTLGNFVNRMGLDGIRHKTESFRPTYMQNLRMLLSYQLYYMYFRYLLWNFAGRQNDGPSCGEIDNGNFITGFKVIDDVMLGNQDLMPSEASRDNPGRHAFYMIPFLLGIIGVIWLARQGLDGRRILAVVTMLFLMTGVAIVFYLNQTPGEPRERDYSFLVSYMAFCIWIAFGLIAIAKILKRIKISESGVVIATSVLAPALPCWMAAENFIDHNRHGRNEVSGFAADVLRMNPGGIIFTQGDNFTFPLWYSQEVEGVGKEHQVIDLSYLATPEYVVNMMHQKHPAARFTAKVADVAYGAYSFTRIARDADPTPVPLIDALRELYSQKEGAPVFRHSVVTLPGITMADTIAIDLQSLTRGGMIPFKRLMMLDLIATNLESDNPVPVYFMTQTSPDAHKMLKSALRPTTFANVYAPWLSDEKFKKTVEQAAEYGEVSEKRPYLDPATADQYRHRRGSRVRAARLILEKGDTANARKIALEVNRKFPYSYISPGDYTVVDSTYFEGKEYVRLIRDLGVADKEVVAAADSLERSIAQRAGAWLRYYRSLPEWRRPTVSNATRRLILAK